MWLPFLSHPLGISGPSMNHSVESPKPTPQADSLIYSSIHSLIQSFTPMGVVLNDVQS